MAKQQPLINLLADQGLVKIDLNLAQTLHTPWYIKILLALGGWLAALFFFAFFAFVLIELVEDIAVRGMLGLSLLIGAYFILRSPKSEFFEHLGLAVSLNGQVLLVWLFFEYFSHTDWLLWLLSAALQLVLAWLMPSYLHRVFSAFFAAYALSVTMALLAIPALFSSVLMLACTWLWLHEFNLKQHYSKFNAIAYGLTLALVLIKSADTLDWLWFAQDINNHSSYFAWSDYIDEGLNCLILLYAVWQLLKRYQVPLSSSSAKITLLGVLLIGLSSMQAPGITVAMLIMLLGFAASHRVLLGLGLISALFYIGKYYYSLEITLTQKSLSLLLLGLTLLLLNKGFSLWLAKGEQGNA